MNEADAGGPAGRPDNGLSELEGQMGARAYGLFCAGLVWALHNE
jgi:hypothetical protein